MLNLFVVVGVAVATSTHTHTPALFRDKLTFCLDLIYIPYPCMNG